MRVQVNGQKQELADGATLGDLVARFELAPKRIAVEVNRDLVPRESYDRTVLKDGDRVEIVTFVGGG
jgi:thiamine biosynthesis protein ThiS